MGTLPKKPSVKRQRAYPVADLAFAHELRVEYNLPWKTIGRYLGYDYQPLSEAVWRLVQQGIH